MSNQSGVRTLAGEAFGSPGGFVQFDSWQYYVDIDGNFPLSTSPAASVHGTVTRDVKLPGGDRLAKVG